MGSGLLRRRGAAARNDGVGCVRGGGGLLRHFVPRNDVARVICVLVAMVGMVGFAEDSAQITVKQQRVVNGVTNALADNVYVATDAEFTSVSADAYVEGSRFVGWEVSPAQPNFTPRDVWGRACEQVSVVPKDSVVTFTAVYKTEGDEAEKEYWYGDTTVAMESDTDGDGYSFTEEIQYGMNPHFPNELKLGGVTYGDGNLLLDNPNEYQPYVIRSEPEGELFASITNYVAPGTVVTTASYSPEDSNFAYWTVDGERQADAFGVAVNAVSFTMPSNAVEVVAHCVTDEQTRQAMYWYGTATAADSDTDGDGYTFAEELQYGMNPIFKNELKLGGVTYGDGSLLTYNPNEYSPYTIRAEPSNTFETVTGYLTPGAKLETGNYGSDETFAYWTINGVRQADAFGRALDSVTLVGTGKIDGGTEAVAHFITDTMTTEERAIAY